MSNRKSHDKNQTMVRIICLAVAAVMILSVVAAAIFTN